MLKKVLQTSKKKGGKKRKRVETSTIGLLHAYARYNYFSSKYTLVKRNLLVLIEN